jgi:hypothetical protein
MRSRERYFASFNTAQLEREKYHFAQVLYAFFEPETATPLRRGNFAALYPGGENGESPTNLGFDWPMTDTPVLDSRAAIMDDEDEDIILPISFEAFEDIEDRNLPIREREPKRKPDLFDEVLGSPGQGHIYEYSLTPPPGDIENLQKPCRRRYLNDDGSSPAIGGKGDTSGWVSERHNDVGFGRPTVVVGLFGEDLLADEAGHTWKLLA